MINSKFLNRNANFKHLIKRKRGSPKDTSFELNKDI